MFNILKPCKMRQVYLLLVGLLFLVSSTITFAQPSKGGLPLSFSDATITSDFEAINVPSINVDQVIAEDAQKGIILWVGRTIPLDYDMSNAGTWTILPNGTKIWRLKLSSLGAKALGVTYSDFYIPEGGKLYIYNDNKNQVIGAFTSENNPDQRVAGRELWKKFRELADRVWAHSLKEEIFKLTGQKDFEFYLVVTKYNGKKGDWENFPLFRKNLTGCSIKLINLKEIILDIYKDVGTTPSHSELTHLLQLMKADSGEIIYKK